MNRKYQIDTAENKAFMKEIREGLLSFGHQFPSPGGGSYYLGDDGTPWKERNRETWITSRMAHVYSIGTMLGYAGSLRPVRPTMMRQTAASIIWSISVSPPNIIRRAPCVVRTV